MLSKIDWVRRVAVLNPVQKYAQEPLRHLDSLVDVTRASTEYVISLQTLYDV